MIKYPRMVFDMLTGRKSNLLAIQGISCLIALGFWIWEVVTFVKKRTLGNIDFKLYPWTYYYFHPLDSYFFNYIFLCIFLGLAAFLVYLLINKKTSVILLDRVNRSHPMIVVVCALLSLVTVSAIVISDSFLKRSIFFIIALCLPILSISYGSFGPLRIHKPLMDKKLLVLSFLLFSLVVLEPIETMVGPVYLINDYPDISSKTIIEDSCLLDNKQFLQKHNKSDMDTVKTYLAIFDEIDSALRSAKNIKTITQEQFRLKIHEDELGLFQKFKNINLNPSQQYFTSLISDSFTEEQWASRFRSLSGINKGLGEDTENPIKRIKTINLQTFKQFYLANYMEYWLQNMGRGQVHHLGHYLNPLNEYELGKPLNSIYIQYGLGSMFLSKWTMDLFGGISIHNFYKIYIYYILYNILFIWMSFALFKDRLYACAAIAIMPASFFLLGYIAYILAPGFIPTVHMLDAITFVALMLFLRSGKWAYLGMLALLTMLGVILNRQFGMALTISLFLSLMLYGFENKSGRYKYFWSFSFCAIFIATIAAYKLFGIGKLDEIFPYYLMGWLSWPVSGYQVSCTIFYLAISYLFIFFLKNHRFYLKYTYIAIFLYAQILLAYYYWSGVRNHLPTAIPFIWVQFILMLYITEKHLLPNRLFTYNGFRLATKGALLLSIVLIIPTANYYYSQKSLFKSNFENHKTYKWEFDRANLISTVDPSLLTEGTDLIKKYSIESNPAIYILSKYDGIIPFLAKKYSAMGFFELTAYIFSKKESDAVINRINTAAPEYLFIDSDLNHALYDPWSKFYRSDYTDGERSSRLNRYLILKNIIREIAGDYEKIEEGTLISVYKRKPKNVLSANICTLSK